MLVAGTGEMGRLVARRLAEAGHRVTVLSRSAERGGAMRDALGGPHRLVVGRSPALAAEHDAVALAVRAREPLLEEDHLTATPPWTLDLSVPSAVAQQPQRGSASD